MIGITGTSGFVGSALVKQIKSNCVQLTYSHGEWKVKDKDFKDSSQITHLIQSEIETLIHLGSFVPKKTEDMNNWPKNYSSILSTYQLLSLNLSNLKKIIFLSSSRATAWDHINSNDSKTIYGASKYISENLIYNYSILESLEYTIIRAGSIFGPGEEKFNRLIPNLIKAAIVNAPLYISDNKEIKLSFLYIDDLVDEIISMMSGKSINGVLNLNGNESLTLTEIANLIIDLTGSKSKIIYYSDTRSFERTDVMNQINPKGFKGTNFITGLKHEIGSYL